MRKISLVPVLFALLFTGQAMVANAAPVSNINGVTAATQFLSPTGTDPNLQITITSSSDTHFFQPMWNGVLQVSRGGTGTSTAPSNGQLLIGNGVGYGISHLTQGSNIFITNGAGSITIAVTSTPAFTSLSLTSPLAAIYGGTGISTFSKGDILVAISSTTLARLPVGQDGQVLVASSTSSTGLAWQTPAPSGKRFQVDLSGTLTSGLVAYYKLEDGNDFWTRGFNLTNNGFVAFSSGKVGNASDYGASNSTKWLSINNNLGIDGGAISVAGWVNVTTAPSSGVTGEFFTQYAGSSNSDVLNDVAYQNSGGTLQLYFERSKVNVSTNSGTYVTTLTTGTWYHVVYTYDGSNIRLYFNGSLVAGPIAASGNGNETNSAYNTEIGGALNGFNLFSGLVDEVGYWNKALSTGEINDLYNGGNGQTMIQ